jgi:hypothetical protein
MCELLVYARLDGPENALHPMRYRPGDVVVVKPDGCVWGTSELCAGSSFRVLVFPGVNESEAYPLLAELPSDLDENQMSLTVRRRRSHRLHLSHEEWPSGFAEWWARDDGTKFDVAVPTLATLTVPHWKVPVGKPCRQP